MVFSSIPAYLDPSNWQQQPNQHPTGATSGNPNLVVPGPAGAASIRPGSMADRARMANVPMPEPGLKCPRCESTNTKFCYFNNYSLTQPRHFCKTCRRYWTRGGALRSVPVGGGCRRNKRSKGGGSSKSSATASGGSTSGGSNSSTATTTTSILGLTPPQVPPLRFMSPLSQLSEFAPSDLGLNYSGISTGISDLNFSGSGSCIEPWRLQAPTGQISSVGGLDFHGGLYPFHSGMEMSGYAGEGSQERPKLSSNLGLISQLGSVKMEENHDRLNPSSMQLMGLAAPTGNDHYWSGAGTPWTEMSGFASSSTHTTPL